MTDADPIVAAVIKRIQDRSDAGMKKYGKSMTRDDKTTLEWIDDAIEEALDLAVYLTRVKADFDNLKEKVYEEGYEIGYENGQDTCRDDWQNGYDEGYEAGKADSDD